MSSSTKISYLAADRNINVWPAAMSIAATWIWAPALFVATQQAYQNGLAGLAWFTIPNVACLILFAGFARRLRERVPDGYTLTGYLRDRYSPRVQRVYLTQQAGLAIASFAVQLVAGGAIIAALTGWPYWLVVTLMAAVTLGYTIPGGLRASVWTDHWQMWVIAVVAIALVPAVLANAGGASVLPSGLLGTSGVDGLTLFLTFGLPTTIGLLSGPFGDQSFWQRAFAIKRNHVEQAFIRGAFIFGLVPLGLGMLGLIGAGAGVTVTDPQLANLSVIQHFLPGWVIIPFTVMILFGLMSTLDSNLCSIASLAGHDLTRDASRAVPRSRWAMSLLAIAATGVALIPGITITHLFLIYGTMRAATLAPTILTFLRERLSEAGVFYGVIASLTIALPLFIYGQLSGSPLVVAGASMLTIILSGGITLAASRQLPDAPADPVREATLYVQRPGGQNVKPPAAYTRNRKG